MSLAVVFKSAEGIVLAADSRVTLTATSRSAEDREVVPAFYDNATKLLKVNGQNYVAAVTYGLGALGVSEPRTAHSFLPEFEAALTKDKIGRLSVGNFAQRLSDFFYGSVAYRDAVGFGKFRYAISNWRIRRK